MRGKIYSQDLKINLDSGKDKEWLTLAVKDYGVGFPGSEQKQIFDQYYRARNTLRGKTEGLGLGLFICKSITGSHKGRIWVKSREGEDSTFYFPLPKRGVG